MPYRIIAQYMQALLGLLNLAIGSPALATNSAVSAVSASWPLSAMDCTSTVGQPTRERNLLAHPTLDMYLPLWTRIKTHVLNTAAEIVCRGATLKLRNGNRAMEIPTSTYGTVP